MQPILIQTQLQWIKPRLTNSHSFLIQQMSLCGMRKPLTKYMNTSRSLVDHYEGAELTEYTLRLIGSDIEHYIRKMLYDGERKYNMNARVLNFSMGKPPVQFNNTDGQLQDVL